MGMNGSGIPRLFSRAQLLLLNNEASLELFKL
jgi:hypothetical protein